MGAINCKEYATNKSKDDKANANDSMGDGAAGSYQSKDEESTVTTVTTATAAEATTTTTTTTASETITTVTVEVTSAEITSEAIKMSECDTINPYDYTEPVMVCSLADLNDNEMKQVDFDLDNRAILVKQNGRIYAVGNKCTHYGAPLNVGALGIGRIRCPWHGACFDLKTGDIEDYPGFDSLPCYKVEISGEGEVHLRAKRKDLLSSKRLKNMVKRKSKDTRVFVVVGGGPSGAVCVETLRQEGYTGRLILITQEPYLPYDRVKVSKAMNVDIKNIQFRDMDFYKTYDIEVMLGVKAKQLDTNLKTLNCSNGCTIKYDKIYIATGCKPYKPPIPGAYLKNVVTVRDYDDAKYIMEQVTSETNVVCLGSSFISMESAAFLVSKAKSVTLIGREDVPFKQSLGYEIGDRMLRLYEDNGVIMRMESGITRIIGDEDDLKVAQVQLLPEKIVLEDEGEEENDDEPKTDPKSDPATDGTEILDADEEGEEEEDEGEKLPCDLLILGTGSSFNTSFMRRSGVTINENGSIDVSDFLETNVPDVYVGGDIANAYLFTLGNERATIGHFQLAQYHGRIAAINMAGTRKKTQAVPFFFTQLFGKGIRFAGHGSYKDIIIDGDLEDLKFVAYYINEYDSVVAIASCGRDPIVAQYAELLSQGKCLMRSHIEDKEDLEAWTAMLTG